MGSSPRVRGTLKRQPPQLRPEGIIPACAGNTTDLMTKGMQNGDHPRVCGEHIAVVILVSFLLGSSPRVRGTRVDLVRKRPRAGIIPACAGNTKIGYHSALRCRDHPRVCGEHPRQRYYTTTQPGSSPRVRGTLLRNKAPILEEGIIPACAGNTRAVGSRRC